VAPAIRGPDDVLTTPMPLFHSGGLHVIVHSALHTGALAHVKSRFSAGSYWDQVADDGATQGLLVGPMAEMVLRQVDATPPHRMEIASISAFAHRHEFEARYRVRVLWQGYGMTEVYPIPMAREMIATSHEDTLGMPADAYDYGVVDDADRPLGPGEVGELVVRPREAGFAFDGYLDDEDATGVAWRGGAFHTGDLASCDRDGVLRYRGRRGDRIRHRGENVDPKEVESVAIMHAAVRDAVAYGVPSDLGDADVKLDVVLDRPVDLEELHQWLVARLARHAVPRYLEVLDELPRNASERVERAVLAAGPVDRPEVFDADGRGAAGTPGRTR
jgi:crotonobetaine/carnitine-CoA ligase